MSGLSARTGTEGVWGSGWVWDGEWVLRLQCNADIVIPTFVLACGDVWQVRYDGAPTVCFKSGDPQHLATTCRAVRREERVIARWESGMGTSTEVFFPT